MPFGRRYVEQPTDQVRGEPYKIEHDNLSPVIVVTHGDVSALTNIDAPVPSAPFARRMFGVGRTTPVQDPDLGAEVKQAGAGRAFISPALFFPVGSGQVEPDRRRIARPMPSASRDESEVIRPERGR